MIGLHPQPKPAKRSTEKGRKDRSEAEVKRGVRAACLNRDGACRLSMSRSHFDVMHDNFFLECDSWSEWAHMHTRRRSQTRNPAAEIRHNREHSLMLCRVHHDQYDGRATPRLRITALSRKGADGPLKFTRAK